MSKTTGISWTNHTWNSWEGCSRISPGCANCYMFEQLKRYGRDPSRVRRTKTWKDPERWNEAARRAGRIDRVLTCSLSDFFHQDADAWRPEAWELIRRCNHLHFQVLTKRPLSIAERLPPDWGEGYPNVWLGVSIESNDYVWRADVLRQIPTRIRWISAEPLLGPLPDLDLTDFHWIVVGGESGRGHRDMDHAWARQLRDQAKAQGMAFFFKQSSGARAGHGDLLNGQRWHQFPSTPAEEPQGTEGQSESEDGEDGTSGDGEQEAEEEPEPELFRLETERLRAELRQQQQEADSLRAELERQRQDSALDRADWAARWEAMRDNYLEARDNYLEASREEKLWRHRATKNACRASELEKHLRAILHCFGLGQFSHQSGIPTFSLTLQQDLAVLRLRWPCTADEVKTAYRQLAKQFHPDRFGDPEQFKKMQAAYDRVMNTFNQVGT